MTYAIHLWDDHFLNIRTQSFLERHRSRPQDFIRQRSLSFAKVMVFLLRTAKKSLQIESNFLVEFTDEEPVTKQALSKARYKINASAFEELFENTIEDYYSKHNTLHLWNGFRVFGGDGSTVPIPDEGNIPSYFGDHFKHVAIARIFQYIELTTDNLVAPCIMPYKVSEDQMAKALLPTLVQKMKKYGNDKQLFVYDRGFPSHAFPKQHLDLSVDFLFRLPRQFNPQIDAALEETCDKDFDLTVNRPNEKYQARVVIKYLKPNQPLILFTSLLDRNQFTSEQIVEAYKMRWRCEESYKFQKVLLQLENFSGKTVQAILQDYWATAFVAIVMNISFMEKEAGLIEKEGFESKSWKINKSVVFGIMRNDFIRVIHFEMELDNLNKKFDRLCKKYRVPIRPNRSYPRLPVDTRKGRHIYRKS